MKRPNDTSSHRSDPVLAASLAAGHTYAEAAATAGVSERTVKRRMASPDFRAMVRQVQDQAAQETAARLRTLAQEALVTLHELLADSAPPSIRLGSARAILEHSLRWQEAVVIEERISALERLPAGDSWAYSRD